MDTVTMKQLFRRRAKEMCALFGMCDGTTMYIVRRKHNDKRVYKQLSRDLRRDYEKFDEYNGFVAYFNEGPFTDFIETSDHVMFFWLDRDTKLHPDVVYEKVVVVNTFLDTDE